MYPGEPPGGMRWVSRSSLELRRSCLSAKQHAALDPEPLVGRLPADLRGPRERRDAGKRLVVVSGPDVGYRESWPSCHVPVTRALQFQLKRYDARDVDPLDVAVAGVVLDDDRLAARADQAGRTPDDEVVEES